MWRLERSRSTSRSVCFAPSIRVEDAALSMVAIRRRADRRSGAIRPMARHAPLNSSIPPISFKTFALMRKSAVFGAPSILSSISIQFHLNK